MGRPKMRDRVLEPIPERPPPTMLPKCTNGPPLLETRPAAMHVMTPMNLQTKVRMLRKPAQHTIHKLSLSWEEGGGHTVLQVNIDLLLADLTDLSNRFVSCQSADIQSDDAGQPGNVQMS